MRLRAATPGAQLNKKKSTEKLSEIEIVDPRTGAKHVEPPSQGRRAAWLSCGQDSAALGQIESAW
jgi:hypothetical protein